MFKLHVLGSGGAWSTKYGNTQLYLEGAEPRTSLLFDCGISHGYNIERCKIDLSKLENIYVSHAHDDHIGGLGTLALMHYFIPNCFKRPKLYARRELMNCLWHQKLAISCETLADNQLPKGASKALFSDFFDLRPIGRCKNFELANYHEHVLCRPIQTVHVVHGSDIMDSFGLEVVLTGPGENDQVKILITGDTQFSPAQLKDRYVYADIIIQDCETGGLMDSPFRSGVHAHIADLTKLSPDVKKKMYLIHYGDNINPNMVEDFCRVYGFAGFLFQGQKYDISYEKKMEIIVEN